VKALRRVEQQVDQGGVQLLPCDQVDRGRDDSNVVLGDHLRQVEEPLWDEQLTDLGLNSPLDVSVLDRDRVNAIRAEQTPNRFRP